MHTDQTLVILDTETVRLGKELRAFSNITCAAFETRELRRETDARKRRLSKNPTAGSKKSAGSEGAGSTLKKFNLQTPKNHFIGDYADTIRLFGTTDSISTEPVRFGVSSLRTLIANELQTGRARALLAQDLVYAHRS